MRVAFSFRTCENLVLRGTLQNPHVRCTVHATEELMDKKIVIFLRREKNTQEETEVLKTGKKAKTIEDKWESPHHGRQGNKKPSQTGKRKLEPSIQLTVQFPQRRSCLTNTRKHCDEGGHGR